MNISTHCKLYNWPKYKLIDIVNDSIYVLKAGDQLMILFLIIAINGNLFITGFSLNNVFINVYKTLLNVIFNELNNALIIPKKIKEHMV